MNFYKKMVILMLIGISFRLFIIFCLPVRAFEDSIKRYHHTAINLVEGRGYSHFNSPPYQPTIFKPPTYSLFLAGIYKIFGVNLMVVKIIQVLMDVFGCLLLFLLARKYFAEEIAFMVMFLACVCPITSVYTNLLNPESLTVFLMILSLYFVSKSILYGNALYFFSAGLSIILMGYCRPEFFSFIFIFGAILLSVKKKDKMKLYLSYLLGVLIIMAPWVARNYYLTGKFIPLTAGGAEVGVSLYLGTLGEEADSVKNFDKFLNNNSKFKQLYTDRYKDTLYNNTLSLKKASQYDKIFITMAIDKILNNPWHYFITRLRSIPRTWINLHADEFTFLNTQKLRLLHPDFQKILYYAKEDPREISILIVKYILLGINIFYLLMALRGLWIVRKRLLKLSFIISPLIYSQILFLFIHRSPNYTIPYWPCIIFFSGIGFYYISAKNI